MIDKAKAIELLAALDAASIKASHTLSNASIDKLRKVGKQVFKALTGENPTEDELDAIFH